MQGPTNTAGGILAEGSLRCEGTRASPARYPPSQGFNCMAPHPTFSRSGRGQGGRRLTMDLARNLKVESVSRLQPTPPLQVRPEQTVSEAVALMREEHVGCVLVCDADKLLGIFTERDLLRRVLAEQKRLSLPVGEVMTPDPVTVCPKQAIGVAIKLMEEGGYRH